MGRVLEMITLETRVSWQGHLPRIVPESSSLQSSDSRILAEAEATRRGGKPKWPFLVNVIACHHELIVECPEHQAEEVTKFLKKVMVAGMN
jgi:hypothetical protein